MIIKLTNYNILLKSKITWKDVLSYETLVFNPDREVWSVLLFFIDNIIEEVQIKEKRITNKKEIEEVIFSTEDTERNDLVKIIDEITEYLSKKKE